MARHRRNACGILKDPWNVAIGACVKIYCAHCDFPSLVSPFHGIRFARSRAIGLYIFSFDVMFARACARLNAVEAGVFGLALAVPAISTSNDPIGLCASITLVFPLALGSATRRTNV